MGETLQEDQSSLVDNFADIYHTSLYDKKLLSSTQNLMIYHGNQILISDGINCQNLESSQTILDLQTLALSSSKSEQDWIIHQSGEDCSRVNSGITLDHIVLPNEKLLSIRNLG